MSKKRTVLGVVAALPFLIETHPAARICPALPARGYGLAAFFLVGVNFAAYAHRRNRMDGERTTLPL